ncbi:hypothetical protein L9F63_004052, partial [Diploptera punctata]
TIYFKIMNWIFLNEVVFLDILRGLWKMMISIRILVENRFGFLCNLSLTSS